MNPWSVQIEMTEGCTRMCKFCGIWSIWRDHATRNLHFMKLTLATKIAEELALWLPKARIEFALQGEPLLNASAASIVKIFRKTFPSCQLLISTNGDPLVVSSRDKIRTLSKDVLLELFDSGLNYLVLENYDNLSYEIPEFDSIEVKSFYSGENPYRYRSSKHRCIVLMGDIATMNAKSHVRVINNQAGNIDPTYGKEFGAVPLDTPLQLRCSNPFHELVIKYDGAITACCMMWKRELVMGKFPEESLADIWQKPAFNALRQLLYDKKRVVYPCSVCDYKGYKTGLLKDPCVLGTTEDLVSLINDKQVPSVSYHEMGKWKWVT